MLNRLRLELSKRKGHFPAIAERAGVDVGWLYSITKRRNHDFDPGVRRVESVLRALSLEVVIDAE